MVIQSVQAKFIESNQLSHDVREFVFEPEIKVEFYAGQYFSLVVGEENNRQILRAYSLSSPPSEHNRLCFVANHIPGGKGSEFLFNLSIGSLVELRGPKGHFCLKETPQRDLLFIATGTGVGPVCAMLKHLLNEGFNKQIRFFWELPAQKDIYYYEELRALSLANKNFTFSVTLTNPDDGWEGRIGNVAELVDENVVTVDNLEIYAVGSGEMISAVKKVINPKGLCPIRSEKFY